MIAMLEAALLVRAARVLPCGRRDRVALAARPGGVVHVVVAPLTPSGRWVARAGRTVCHTRTGRLTVVPRRGDLPAIDGRRICSRCMAALARRTDIPGLDQRPMTREQEQAAFSLLSPEQLTAIASTCRTVDETHQVGRLASVLFGPASMKPKARRTPHEQSVADLHHAVHAVRRRLTSEALTDDEREAVHRARDLESAEHARIQTARRKSGALDRTQDRARRGQYLMPHERDHLRSA